MCVYVDKELIGGKARCKREGRKGQKWGHIMDTPSIINKLYIVDRGRNVNGVGFLSTLSFSE